MQDPLIEAAEKLGVATHSSAGPEPGSLCGQLWATWPRDRLEVAHEALARVSDYDSEARVERCGRANMWTCAVATARRVSTAASKRWALRSRTK